jgi:hypothetical protein
VTHQTTSSIGQWGNAQIRQPKKWMEGCVHVSQKQRQQKALPGMSTGPMVPAPLPQQCSRNNLSICVLQRHQQTTQYVTNKDVRKALKAAAIVLDYPAMKGIPIDRINTHSPQSRGANALFLAGYSDT